jgi:hypothetical protein
MLPSQLLYLSEHQCLLCVIRWLTHLMISDGGEGTLPWVATVFLSGNLGRVRGGRVGKAWVLCHGSMNTCPLKTVSCSSTYNQDTVYLQIGRFSIVWVVLPRGVPLKGRGQISFPRNAEKKGTHFILGSGNTCTRIHRDPSVGVTWSFL